jgi:beta-glucanase (GH16 family)
MKRTVSSPLVAVRWRTTPIPVFRYLGKPFMIRLYFVLFIASSLINAAGAEPWKLVWSDEFEMSGAPDPAKWGFQKGFVRNKELQYYTDCPENARVENGMLLIEARKERVKNRRFKSGSGDWRRNREFGEYSSADLTTKGLFSWTFGRVEVRAKLPEGSGVWPAIWAMGDVRTGWPSCGEIDLMEYVGADPDILHSGIHFKDLETRKHRKIGVKWPVTAALSGDFHVYALERTAERIDFFLDDQLVQSIAVDEAGPGADNPFRKPHFLLLNLAMGGWGGEVDESLFPHKFWIDYVRVFTKESE